MSRKTLGPVMVALTLSAVAASTAQAANHHFTTTAPAVITAKLEVSVRFQMTDGERELECKLAIYEGTTSTATSSEVTLRPTFTECKVNQVLFATVEANHCAFVFTGETDANGDAKMQLECETGNEITVTYEALGSECAIHVKPQALTGGAHYTQAVNTKTGKKDITASITVTKVHYEETGEGFCPGNHTGTDGELTGDVTMEAHVDNGSAETGTAKTTPTLSVGAAKDLELTTT